MTLCYVSMFSLQIFQQNNLYEYKEKACAFATVKHPSVGILESIELLYVHLHEWAGPVLSKRFCSLLADTLRFVQMMFWAVCPYQIVWHSGELLSVHLFLVLLKNLGTDLMYLHFWHTKNMYLIMCEL